MSLLNKNIRMNVADIFNYRVLLIVLIFCCVFSIFL